MGAVYKKELRSNLTGVVGVLFIAVVLVFMGIFTYVYQFSRNSSHFEYAVISASFYSLIAVPVLTMRSFSEESHQKTDILLYSLPISSTKVVLGKYFAMVTVFALPTALICFYPLVINSFSESGIGMKMVYGAILAYFLLGCAVIAICMFISSLTESQVIAAVLSLVAVLLMYFLDMITGYISTSWAVSLTVLIIFSAIITGLIFYLTKNYIVAGIVGVILLAATVIVSVIDNSVYEGLTLKIVGAVCVFTPIENFAYGVFDILCYIYYFSFAALFVFFTVQSFERKRWM